MGTDEIDGKKDIAIVKHDIKNQLSNISLSLTQLQYEIPDKTADCQFYLDTILESCKKINTLLDNL